MSIIPSIDTVIKDRIAELAATNWLSPIHNDFNSDLVKHIYKEEMLESGFSSNRLSMLELSQYMEKYLWPFYTPKQSSAEHILSITAMINEKFRERLQAWEIFENTNSIDKFGDFFNEICFSVVLNKNCPLKARTLAIEFLSYCITSMEIDFVRNHVQKILGIQCWTFLPKNRLEAELQKSKTLSKYWNHLQRKSDNSEDDKSTFICSLLDSFIDHTNNSDEVSIDYCQSIVEFLTDALSQLPTRRFLISLMDAQGILVRSQQSVIYEKSDLFRKSLDLMMKFLDAEIDDCTGQPLSYVDKHYQNFSKFQRCLFKILPQINDTYVKEKVTVFAASSIVSVDNAENIRRVLSSLPTDLLKTIGSDMLFDLERCGTKLIDVLIHKYSRRIAPLDALNALPLFQTEEIIWDENLVPNYEKAIKGKLALPKLNLQFLTLLDYLQRNFTLFRLESTYEIRQDLEIAITRLRPIRNKPQCAFEGWSRMALPIQAFSVVEVRTPLIGEKCPSVVKADFEIAIDIRDDVKEEWLHLRRHDVLFLISLEGIEKCEDGVKTSKTFAELYNIKYIRGCEIEGMLDANGRLIDDANPNDDHVMPTGNKRTFRVWLDVNQYYNDISNEEDIYAQFNVIVRRKPKENNFKAILDTIRTLMNVNFVVPEWLNDLLLGYGDPASACYWKICPDIALKEHDWHDTFVSLEHLKKSFPQYSLQLKNNDSKLFYRLRIDDSSKTVEAISYDALLPGPLSPKKRINKIPFTVAQISAIRSGMLPGLTMIVGPPGTGKTDVAVQIIANIYRNYPDQRTLVVAHSNQALNQLFEKIIDLEVDQRHLLRLGHGESELSTDLDFSRYGRVNYILQHRLDLLAQVDKLAKTLSVQTDVADTCETAQHFFLYEILYRWEEFLKNASNDKENIQELFPFKDFFGDLLQFEVQQDKMAYARSCFRDIVNIFKELQEFTALEQMRNGAERAKYLLVKEAKIVAMTCTHAALKRKDLVEYGFKYDNILMEEAAQILEIETFIPLLLQNPDIGHLRLKRWIMIGDHNQLAPVIKNVAFQKFANMEQSLFTRLIRLGVPSIDLDAQGRSRPSIAKLYQWRYRSLGNLAHTVDPMDLLANPGFVYDYQLIDCESVNGVGESEPVAHFYQNLSEAEYVRQKSFIALYMFMILSGYSNDKITIITTYNGQKHLIREIIKRRCSDIIPWPSKITTVDKFQGQQNDYILLSLVRTKTVGHLRDVRRLIVAMSRARLGLYIFARVQNFCNCVELSNVFQQLLLRPLSLHLVVDEKFSTCKRMKHAPPNGRIMSFRCLQELVVFVNKRFQKYRSNLSKNQKIEQSKQEANRRRITEEEYDPAYPEFQKRARYSKSPIRSVLLKLVEEICGINI